MFFLHMIQWCDILQLIDSIVGKGWGEIFQLEEKKQEKQEKEQSQDVL